MAIRNPEGVLVISDRAGKQTLNEDFSTIGEKLAGELPILNEDLTTYATRVTPTIMRITLTPDVIKKASLKLKPGKASGRDGVAPRLLKLAGNGLVPSLLSVFTSSASTNTVPLMWKSANASSLYKSNDETNKLNYRPISLLCVPGKIVESCVAVTVTSHIREHDLSDHNQWAYKKGHSTDLLIRMTEDWRQALDNGLAVGVVFVDFRKAFDTVSHSLLLQNLQGLGIKDYLINRTQVTVVNGCKSERRFMKYGVPQGSGRDWVLHYFHYSAMTSQI